LGVGLTDSGCGPGRDQRQLPPPRCRNRPGHLGQSEPVADWPRTRTDRPEGRSVGADRSVLSDR